jgi:hypothetical protein
MNAVARRKKAVKSARGRDDLAFVDPHGDPSKGGSGYLARERERAACLYRSGERDPMKLGMSTDTARSWSIKGTASNYENVRTKKPGPQREVSNVDVAFIHFAKSAYPTMTAPEMSNFLNNMTGNGDHSHSTFSRMLHDYNPHQTMTRKKIESRANEACVAQQTAWLNLPPGLGGVAGLDVWRMWDIDESCFYYIYANRTFGHAPSGQTPIEHQDHENPPNSKISMILGVDRMGNFAIELSADNVDNAGWISYLNTRLFPICGPSRVLLFDNLRQHVTAQSMQTILNAGRLPLPRPVYSPHLAPIKFIFGLIEAHLRRLQYKTTPQNFQNAVITAVRGAVTPSNCRAVFEH